VENSNDINIAEINQDLQNSYIHYEPNRVDYTINNLELELLEQAGSNIWKDIFWATLGLGIPSLINGCTDYCNLQPNTALTLSIFLNFLIAGISLTLSVICLVVWMQNKKNFKKIIGQIKNKPRYKLPGA
jgi:hypothetical protein